MERMVGVLYECWYHYDEKRYMRLVGIDGVATYLLPDVPVKDVEGFLAESRIQRAAGMRAELAELERMNLETQLREGAVDDV